MSNLHVGERTSFRTKSANESGTCALSGMPRCSSDPGTSGSTSSPDAHRCGSRGEPCSGRCVVEADGHAYGVETDDNQTNRPKKEAIPAQTCGTRNHRARRSQSRTEGSPSRQGKGIRVVKHGREIAPRPAPIIISRGFRQGTDRGLAEASQEERLASPLSGCGRKFSLPPANVLPASCCTKPASTARRL